MLVVDTRPQKLEPLRELIEQHSATPCTGELVLLALQVQFSSMRV